MSCNHNQPVIHQSDSLITFNHTAQSTNQCCPPHCLTTGTETPTDNWLGLVLDGCLFLLLGLLWNVSQVKSFACLVAL
jgi:hypothetical protein